MADLFRRHGPASRAQGKDRLLPSHRRALEAIAPCRPEARGGPVSQGTAGGALAYSEHACTKRHCPTGPKAAATPGVEPQRALLLPVPSVLVTLPWPAARRPVARSHQTRLSTRRVQTSARALQALALDPTYRGGPRGMVGVLHPWTRQMGYHPPRPSLVPGGALAPDGSTWLTPPDAEWLVPVHALAKRFRGKVQAALRTTGLLTHVPPQGWQQGWMTHGPAAGTGPAVLSSFAPSLSRVAITTSRLEKGDDGPGTVRVTERTSHPWTPRTLPVDACIRRFLQHVLPQGCPQVRYDGVLSPSRRPALAQRRTLLAASPPSDQATQGSHDQDRREPPPAPEAALHGRACGGPRVFLDRLVPHQSRPPSCAREVTRIPDGCPVGSETREGVRPPPGTASEDCCGLRTPPQTMRVALTEVHRPMPRCQRVSMRVWGLWLPHGDLHARRFPVPPPCLPHIENPNALMLSTGLFNPALCGGSAPHEFLFVRLVTPFHGRATGRNWGPIPCYPLRGW